MPPREQSTQRRSVPQPTIGPDGFDQFGIGPLLRHAQLSDGTYPTPPRSKPVRLPLSAYGGSGERDPVVVQVNVSGLATADQVRRLEADIREVAAAVVALERSRGRGS